jgi:aspartyl aminopeptidase
MPVGDDLVSFLRAAVSPFHAVAWAVDRLGAAGFTPLDEAATWSLAAGGRYLVTREDRALIAFTTGRTEPVRVGLRLAAAHTDSPGLRLKPNPLLLREGCLQLGVEVYGGALLAPWFDRDLSIAGRVSCLTPRGLVSVLIDFQRPLAVIPSLAIHLDREANNGRAINAQKDLPPIVALHTEGDRPQLRELLARQVERQYPQLALQEVLDGELLLYDTAAPTRLGLRGEFVSGARLDNLLSCYATVTALEHTDGQAPALLVLSDHEEVGSQSRSGAGGPFLRSVLERAFGAGEVLERTLARSLCISVDNAHAVHPNFADRMDPQHAPRLGGGPVLKLNAGQRYATSGATAALFRLLCRRVGVPLQEFVMRSDLACGSTIGPITAGRLGVATVDVGVPSLAMHSARELAAADDVPALVRVLRAFFTLDQPPLAGSSG